MLLYFVMTDVILTSDHPKASDLKRITQGISTSIMEVPPPPDIALGFRFSEESAAKDMSQDKFLCSDIGNVQID